MIICVCNRISDRDIKQAAAEGCSTLRELQALTNLGTQCGHCCESACEVLESACQKAKAGGKEGMGA